MVYQVIAGFLLSSVGSTSKGEGNLVERITTLAIIVVALLIVIFAVNTFCYFSPQCTNFWEVLVPDWLEAYLGDIFLDQETAQEQNKTSILTRATAAGVFGIIPAAFVRVRGLFRNGN